MNTDCKHTGYHSGIGRYSRDEARLYFVVVCDQCGRELQEISSVGYVPAHSSRNDREIAAALQPAAASGG